MEKMVQLIINPGSATVKMAVFHAGKNILSVQYERHSTRDFSRTINNKKGKVSKKIFENCLKDFFTAWEKGTVSKSMPIRSVGFRYVSGGPKYREIKEVTPTFLRSLKKLDEYAPLHNPPARKLVETAAKLLPQAKLFVVFDTAFHQDIPEVHSHSALPKKWSKKHHIQKLGFHGIVCSSIVHQLKSSNQLKKQIIVCHLGSGCSVTAIKNGKSINTSMGFTPLGGMMMGTRTGDMDPGEILYLIQKERFSLEKISEILNRESGLKGVAGEKDMRKVIAASKKDPYAKLARDMFCFRAAEEIARQSISLGKIDQLIFSGGIGENAPHIREDICKKLIPLGIQINNKKNQQAKNAQSFQKAFSKTQLLWIHADEESEMNRQLIN